MARSPCPTQRQKFNRLVKRGNLLSERGDDWHAHPEPDLLPHHDGPDGGHRLVPAQLRACR